MFEIKHFLPWREIRCCRYSVFFASLLPYCPYVCKGCRLNAHARAASCFKAVLCLRKRVFLVHDECFFPVRAGSTVRMRCFFCAHALLFCAHALRMSSAQVCSNGGLVLL
jgi:hypothetical protein